jgi:hypothetical protein
LITQTLFSLWAVLSPRFTILTLTTPSHSM